MRYYAEFYRLETVKGHTSYREVLGDRGVLRLDGRNSLQNMMRDAQEWAKKHKFDGYRVARGRSLSNLFYLNAAVQPVSKEVLPCMQTN